MENLNKAFKEVISYFKEYADKRVLEDLDDCLPGLRKNDVHLFANTHTAIRDSVYKQLIFETCLVDYYRKSKIVSMYSHMKECDGEAVYEDVKKQYIRSFDKLKRHQDKVFTSLGIDEDDINELHKNDTKTRYIYPYQKIQYEIMNFLNPLLYKFATGKFSKSHNYINFQAEEALKSIDVAYKMIADSELNYFEKCIQYYHLEVQYHIETIYRFFKVAQEINRPIKELKQDISVLKRLLGFINGEDNTSNHIIIGIDVVSEIYRKYPDSLNKIVEFLYVTNENRKIITRNFKANNALKYDVNDFVTCDAAEEFFRDYIGMGQHIVNNKNYANDINIKYFRKIY